ncbi:response regulator [Nocardia takedensis]
MTATPITVLLVDDEPLARAGLAAIIDAHDDIEVVGEAADGANVLPLLARLRPAVIAMDVRMPLMDGIETTRAIVATLSARPKILIITTFENDDYVYEALRAGANGFLLKRARPAEIANAIRTVAAGDSLLYPAAVRTMATGRADPEARAAFERASLTAREKTVLRYLARGLNNAEIAGAMHLGTETVKTHVSAVLAKLSVRDRTQAVIMAYESGFVGT